MKKHDKTNVRLFRNTYSGMSVGVKEAASNVSASYILVQTVEGYVELGDRDMAFAYVISEVESLMKAGRYPISLMRHYLEKPSEKPEKRNEEIPPGVDLVFDDKNHRVFVKGVGTVEFRNQYILLDLMRLFALNQGSVYPKEYLVEHVWRQPYDSATHDNKIYVTIRRLRRMMEPDIHRPTYILKEREGYCLSKSVRVYIKNASNK